MTKLTRRRILALAGGSAGLAACQTGTEVAEPFAGTVQFEHGVASGDALSDRVILWTRVTPVGNDPSGPVTVIWQMFEDAELTREMQAGAVQTSAARDYTVKVDVAGLQPARDYYYAFSVHSTAGIVASPRGRTRTLAASGLAPVKAAVVSCSNLPFGHFNVYDALAQRDDLDVIIHLGDYLYEYGRDGYGGTSGKALGRNHEPPTEITELADYRTRHAQYKADKALQRAHGSAPWICTWDDHESANNSYRTGAENHSPDTEGSWTARKQQAVQAYLEWMPVRDPVPGAAREALWRRFDFGDLASLMCLETRLTGRSEELSWSTALAGLQTEEMEPAARQTLAEVNAPARTMLGADQENWLSDQLTQSTGEGKVWQVLANQTIMARTVLPNFAARLTGDQIAAAVEAAGRNGNIVKTLVRFSALGLPSNLDAWDGFPAARERLYEAAKAANASLITLTGDTHTAWANSLHDAAGSARGVEFGCTSVTSPGIGAFVQGVEGIGDMYADANEEVDWFDPDGHGFTLLEISAEAARAEFYKVSTIRDSNYTLSLASKFETRRGETGKLRPV